MSKGLTIVLSAPSGGGKGTILKELFKRNENLKLSVSATTRNPRPGEEHGVHYYFVSHDEFKSMVDGGKMLEYAQYVGNFYGTPKEPVDAMTEQGYDVVLEIEVQGGVQVIKSSPEVVSIFIVPPSMEVLEKRLRGRGTEDEATIAKRIATAKGEIPQSKYYDYIVVNDDLDVVVNEIAAIIEAEKHKYIRNTDLQILKDVAE